jgi:uncharacterized protein (DUF1778 family)
VRGKFSAGLDQPPPTAAKRQTGRRQTLNSRIRAEERGLIDRAAKARGVNRTDVILDAAHRAAEDALVDRALILVPVF